MSPRRSVAEARTTRESIVARAVEISSVEGLEGITVGRLASDLQMSKSGVLGHFGTKERLQLAAIEAAIEVFRREVWERASAAEPGIPRLLAICDAWISYLERDVFPGGCFMTAAACEFDGRAGPVRDAIAGALSRWFAALAAEARVATDAGDLPAGTDPQAIAMQLNALAMGANQALQLHGDRQAAQSVRRTMRALLTPPETR